MVKGDRMTKVIAIASGKGGVGKTTLTINLAASLVNQGKRVIIVDTNLTAPNLALHLGIPAASIVTLNDVIRNEAYITHALYKHRAGFYVVPANVDEIEHNMGGFKNALKPLLGMADVIFLDVAPGVNKEVETALKVADEIVLVTTPDEPSLRNVMLLNRFAKDMDKPIAGVVVNQAKNVHYELSDNEIADKLGCKVLGRIRYHRKFRESIVIGMPFVNIAKGTEQQMLINKIANALAESKPPEGLSFLEKVKAFLNKDIVLWSE